MKHRQKEYKTINLTKKKNVYVMLCVMLCVFLWGVTAHAATVPKTSFTSTYKCTNNSITVAWTKKSGISGYYLQCSTDSSFRNIIKKVYISSSSTNKTTIKGLSSGKKYYFRVRTYKMSSGKKVFSGWSSVISRKTISATEKNKITTVLLNANIQYPLGRACLPYWGFTYDDYAKTAIAISFPGVNLVYSNGGYSLSSMRSSLASKMNLYFGTTSIAFKKFTGYMQVSIASDVYKNDNGTIRYLGGDWGTRYPKPKIAKITKRSSTVTEVVYDLYWYNASRNALEGKMGRYLITLKKANNANGFIISNIKQTAKY